MPTEVELAYLAGIIDGEGTITLTRGLKSDRFRALVMSVANTDLSMINYLKDTYGGRTSKRNRLTATHHMAAFDWRVERRKAVELLEGIYPYLRNEVKRDRAKHTLDHYIRVTPRNGQYTDAMIEEKAWFESTFFSL